MGNGGRPVAPGDRDRVRLAMVSTTRSPLLLAFVFASCGGDTGSTPTAAAMPSAAPSPAATNMTLLAHLDGVALSGGGASVNTAGCWGYTAPDGRRYALVGTTGGLAVVNVTTPRSSRLVGFIAGAESTWREIRTFREYAYVTTEAKTGLDIVDLTDPDRPEKVQTWNQTFTSAHSLWIDEDRGLLFANGTTQGMRVLTLDRDPREPTEVGSFTDFYIHDSFTRGTTLYAAAINDGLLAILDVERPDRIREESRFLTGGRFTHNAWTTDDGRYLFTTDERRGRPVEVWDIADILAARKVAEYIGRAVGIPHNVMVDGNRLLVSHYDDGVFLVDIRNPERPTTLGSYDTYPGVVTGTFGCWGAYVFPGTNLIVASDITGGLFVLEYTGP